MNLSRRQALMYCTAGATVVALGGLGAISPSMADDLLDKEINTFTGGKTPAAGKVTLTVPEIAENGNTVPVSVSVDSKMTDGDLVQSVMLVADANPFPSVATFNFTALGTAAATTRIRLAKTQNVIAIAKMADGSVYMDKKLVKVTIGGCGG
ncbi:thiosulfate oxidation carrier protein SoxY [Hyphomicrobium methylovorum]|uniref:thiosulfate oxidation carrier protein SoxY n=1 Tax=Hyphomicrobium methylovorum TaxID=84 RepID=UPI0015E778EC|nr:thiosulfate oxidation carrier protein SoxY [Hyphomicrobium methylovorum]MBA2127455.1 thiosulfate oxidation carrier protein SoxY [Hyphomicrobium methylovorum]